MPGNPWSVGELRRRQDLKLLTAEQIKLRGFDKGHREKHQVSLHRLIFSGQLDQNNSNLCRVYKRERCIGCPVYKLTHMDCDHPFSPYQAIFDEVVSQPRRVFLDLEPYREVIDECLTNVTRNG